MLKHNIFLHKLHTFLGVIPNRILLSMTFSLEQILRRLMFVWLKKGSERGLEYNLVGEYLNSQLKHSINNIELLDIGPGDSLFIHWLVNKNLSVSAIDIEIHSVQRSFDIVQGDALELPFKNETFDFITLISVIEHIKKCKECLLEIKQSLVSGGKVLITTPIEPNFWHPEFFERTLIEVFSSFQFQYYQISNYCPLQKDQVLNLFGNTRILAFAVLEN